jgi:hypothetical protein
MSNDQRQELSAQYKKMYGKSLIEDLQSCKLSSSLHVA